MSRRPLPASPTSTAGFTGSAAAEPDLPNGERTSPARLLSFADELIRVPNGRPFLGSLLLSPERLRSGSKAAIPIPALRAILELVVASLPFDQKFYAETYSDLAEAHKAGQIPDLHRHYVKEGYFEGRFGTKPEIDEEFYKRMYPDVAAAVASGELESGYDHYLRAGAIEGRFASRADMDAWEDWLRILSRT